MGNVALGMVVDRQGFALGDGRLLMDGCTVGWGGGGMGMALKMEEFGWMYFQVKVRGFVDWCGSRGAQPGGDGGCRLGNECTYSNGCTSRCRWWLLY